MPGAVLGGDTAQTKKVSILREFSFYLERKTINKYKNRCIIFLVVIKTMEKNKEVW